MWDSFGPLHQGEELLVGCLADISDGVVGLERKAQEGNPNSIINALACKLLQ